MTEDYNKPLKAVYEIDGVDNEIELRMAGDVLMKIYNLACDITNNGGIDEFNSKWKREHPDWVYTGDPEDEYTKSYERYFKSIADGICDHCKSPYKLKETPCLLNFKEGWVKIRGYKEIK